MSESYFQLFLSAIVLHVSKLFEAFWSKIFGVEILGPVFHCEPGGASFSSHNMQKWLFHPFLRWINSVWIEIVFSSGKIHTLNVWNSFVSIMIFLSYYKQRKNVHEVFSSLDQFRLKFPNIVFLSALADEKYKWGFFIPGLISAEISKCSFFICFSWWKVHLRFFHPWINFSQNPKWGILAEIDPGKKI